MKGKIGTNTSTIIYTRGFRRKKHKGAIKSNCKKCIHAVVKDGTANCMVTGVIAVNKPYCEFYRKQASPLKKSSVQEGNHKSFRKRRTRRQKLST